MRNLSKIPIIYKSAYLNREYTYMVKETAYLDYTENTEEECDKRIEAMDVKRDEFFEMWMTEYTIQHGFHAQRLFEHINSSRGVTDALFNATDEELNNAYTGKI